MEQMAHTRVRKILLSRATKLFVDGMDLHQAKQYKQIRLQSLRPRLEHIPERYAAAQQEALPTSHRLRKKDVATWISRTVSEDCTEEGKVRRQRLCALDRGRPIQHSKRPSKDGNGFKARPKAPELTHPRSTSSEIYEPDEILGPRNSPDVKPHRPTLQPSPLSGTVSENIRTPDERGTPVPNSSGVIKSSGGGLVDRRDDHGPEYSIFVGDLGPEVNEFVLVSLFHARFPSCKSAKIMTDAMTGQSRGYGFVRFSDESDQQRALVEMQGVYCGNGPMRISTATPKTHSHQYAGHGQGTGPIMPAGGAPAGPMGDAGWNMSPFYDQDPFDPTHQTPDERATTTLVDEPSTTAKKRWRCQDPATVGIASAVEAFRPLSKCNFCSQGKLYGTNYGAAAHLRRSHFKIKHASGSAVSHDKRKSGKGSGEWPPMKELRNWMEEVVDIDHEPDDFMPLLDGFEDEDELPSKLSTPRDIPTKWLPKRPSLPKRSASGRSRPETMGEGF